MKNMTNSFIQRKKPSSSWGKPIESGLRFYILTAVKFFRPTSKVSSGHKDKLYVNNHLNFLQC